MYLLCYKDIFSTYLNLNGLFYIDYNYYNMDFAHFLHTKNQAVFIDARDIEDYELTVCSAGLDNAFMVDEQYQKYLGKEVSVLLTNGKRNSGLIISCDKTLILQVIKKKKGSGKEYIMEQVNIPKEEIKETKLKINFK